MDLVGLRVGLGNSARKEFVPGAFRTGRIFIRRIGMNRILEQLEADNERIEGDVAIRAPGYGFKDEDIGRLSAEAVQKQYEVAAKAVTEMGEVIKERIKRLEQALQECDNDMKVIAEMAAAIVDKGTHVAAEIEHTNAVAADIRTACAEFQKKIVGGKS
jgi:hypothetical protein